MITGTPDPHQIRQYLLGRLDENDELENDLSERILLQNDVSELADLIEDEIIEQYLDDTLDTADRNDVEKYFLRPAERRERLQFARLLRERLGPTKTDVVSPRQEHDAPRTDVLIAGGPFTASVSRHSFLRAYGQLAALLLICIASVTYISSLQQKQGHLEASLRQEQDRAAALEKESLLLQSRTPPFYLAPVATRAVGEAVRSLDIKPSTELALLDLALRRGVNGDIYNVVLKKAGAMEPIWSARLPTIISLSGDARLVFDMPVQGLETGRYSLVVSSMTAGPSYQELYEFEARVTK